MESKSALSISDLSLSVYMSSLRIGLCNIRWKKRTGKTLGDYDVQCFRKQLECSKNKGLMMAK